MPGHTEPRGGRKPIGTAAGAFWLGLCLALFLSACGRSVPPVEPRAGLVIPQPGPLVLRLGDDGTLVPMALGEEKRASQDQGRPHAPFAMARAVAAIQPRADEGILAINRSGLVRLRVERHHEPAEARLLLQPLPQADGEFAGRTVGSTWGRDGEAFFLLYHHPIFEAAPPRSPPSAVVAATADGARIVDIIPGTTAYAVYPVAADGWLVQYRSDDGQRVTTSYARLNAATGAVAPLGQLAFEKDASPLPLSSAPASLAAAAAGLTGPLLIEARLPDGTRRTYLRGDAAEASPAWAQVTGSNDGPIAALLVTDDWRISVVPAQAATGAAAAMTNRYEAPLSEARVRDAAVVNGAIIIVWEEDMFPDIGASGIMVIESGL